MKMKKSRSVALCASLVATLFVGVVVKTGMAEGVAGVWTDIAGAFNANASKGLTGVYVVIHTSEGAQKVLPAEQVRSDVEGQLRQEGIRVLSKKEWLTTPGRPQLWVHVHMTPARLQGVEDTTGFSYNLHVSLLQDCMLTRDAGLVTPAVTWEVESWGTADKNGANTIRNDPRFLRSLMSQFTKAYLAENPRK